MHVQNHVQNRARVDAVVDDAFGIDALSWGADRFAKSFSIAASTTTSVSGDGPTASSASTLLFDQIQRAVTSPEACTLRSLASFCRAMSEDS